MTNQHPLTDEMCWEMAGTWREKSYCDGMRSAYDLAIEHVWNVWDELIETSESDYKLAFRFHRKLYDMRPQ